MEKAEGLVYKIKGGEILLSRATDFGFGSSFRNVGRKSCVFLHQHEYRMPEEFFNLLTNECTCTPLHGYTAAGFATFRSRNLHPTHCQLHNVELDKRDHNFVFRPAVVGGGGGNCHFISHLSKFDPVSYSVKHFLFARTLFSRNFRETSDTRK